MLQGKKGINLVKRENKDGVRHIICNQVLSSSEPHNRT